MIITSVFSQRIYPKESFSTDHPWACHSRIQPHAGKWGWGKSPFHHVHCHPHQVSSRPVGACLHVLDARWPWWNYSGSQTCLLQYVIPMSFGRWQLWALFPSTLILQLGLCDSTLPQTFSKKEHLGVGGRSGFQGHFCDLKFLDFHVLIYERGRTILPSQGSEDCSWNGKH